jgi:predicted ATPase
MSFLRYVELNSRKLSADERYPFTLPLVRSFERLLFNSPITFFVGENGTGKSTLLSAIAAAIGSIVVGSDGIDTDSDFAAARELAPHLKLTWNVRTRKGFFLRAEDFINYTKQLARMRIEMEADIRQVDKTYATRSQFTRDLAKMPFSGSLQALRNSYGDGLDKQSHGESFFNLFHSRFVPGGIYLLDEPETPLSPLKQLSLISMIRDMENQGSQFIIATHSPILMAYPGATILSFDDLPARPVPYSELEHVNLTRDFLNHPDRFLRHL